jgi:P2 family phage contractile tail tube protein
MNYANKTVQYSIYEITESEDVGGVKGSAVGLKRILDTTSVKRPSIETLTETISGAGIAGELDIPTTGQIGAMEYEISYNRTNKDAVRLFGQGIKHLEVRWVTDVLDSETGKINLCSNKEIIKAIPKKFDLGSVENNAANEATVALEITYYKYIQNGETLIEIDKLNNVIIINGVDYTKEIRKAL